MLEKLFLGVIFLKNIFRNPLYHIIHFIHMLLWLFMINSIISYELFFISCEETYSVWHVSDFEEWKPFFNFGPFGLRGGRWNRVESTKISLFFVNSTLLHSPLNPNRPLILFIISCDTSSTCRNLDPTLHGSFHMKVL